MVMLCLKTPVSREVQGTSGVRPVVAAVEEGGETGTDGAGGGDDGPLSPAKGKPAGKIFASAEPGCEKKFAGEIRATAASKPSTSTLNRRSENQLKNRPGE